MDLERNQIAQLVKQRPPKKLYEIDIKMQQQFQNCTKGSALYALFQLRANTFEQKQKMKYKWRPPKHIRNLQKNEIVKIRSNHLIQVDGNQVPPPITSFKDMRFPQKILNILYRKGYKEPTAIQMQTIPIILSGRDLIGVSITGTGKTLSFILPCIIQCLQQQIKLPIIHKQGPFSLIITPSHQLAIQISEAIKQFFQELIKQGYPKLSLMICIGGHGIRQQLQQIKNGVHIIVATPGRISHLLDKKQFNLKMCQTVVMDEADRLLDLGFQSQMKKILQNITGPYKTLLFCASISKKTVDLAKYVLYKPIVVKINDKKDYNLNVMQEFQYLKQEEKTISLIEALKKTDPKVIIFCENKNQCDNVHLYLLLKGLEATCLHGGKREIKSFKVISISQLLLMLQLKDQNSQMSNISQIMICRRICNHIDRGLQGSRNPKKWDDRQHLLQKIRISKLYYNQNSFQLDAIKRFLIFQSFCKVKQIALKCKQKRTIKINNKLIRIE